MKDDICSIPISEIFEKKEGCPFCRMQRVLEQHLVEYILGPAMMEPDVRIETNRLGFCARHYGMMSGGKNRLALGLIQQSRLIEVEKRLKPKRLLGITAGPSALKRAERETDSCFICGKVDESMERLTGVFFRQWKRERDFRRLAAEQPYYCLPHYAALLKRSERELDKNARSDFEAAVAEVEARVLTALRSDIDHFCEMFDYQNTEGDWGESRDAIERSIRFLTGDK